MAGVILYPNKMKAKTQTMMDQLDRLMPYAESAYRALGMVQDNSSLLKGIAWESVQKYMSEVQQPLMQTHQLWIETQKAVTVAYHGAACLLPNVYSLDRDRLEADKSKYERWLRNEYRRDSPNYRTIIRYETMIGAISLKLAAITIFINTTARLYDDPKRILEILGRADAQLSNVGMDPVSGIIDYAAVDVDWLLEMQDKLDSSYLEKLGIPPSQIERMKKLGLSSDQMIKATKAHF